jgi:ABC-type Fe3+ transport system permease subunit
MVFSWVLCFTELPSTLVALRPGYQTVQMRIFNMVHYQSIGEVSALCVLSILAAMVPLIAFSLFTSGRPRQ